MATTTTTAPAEIPGLAAADKNFMDSWYQAVKDHPAASRKYTEWGTALAKIPTYDKKLAYIQKIISLTDSKYKDKIPPLAVNWLVESNPGIVDSKGNAFSNDFYKGIISGDTKTQTANSTALKTAKTKVATESAKLANPKATSAELATIVADIVNGSSIKPYNPETLTKAVISTPSASLYKAGSMTADKLNSTYGNILDPDTGEPLFSADYLNKIASATTAGDVQGFNDTLSKIASKVLASQKGSNYLVQSDADKAKALSDLLKNPETLASGTESLYKKSTGPKTGINGLLPVGSFKDDKGNFVYNGGEIQPEDMSEFVQTYNNQGIANRGAYVAPTFNSATGMYESKSTSPYANALTSLLGSTKNPFASDYTSSLATRQPAAMTSTQLASLNKPFKENTTARDIINLQNSAGLSTGNELTKGSSLSKNLLDLYQTNPNGSAINSPWVADTEDMVIPTTTMPTIDTSTKLVQLDPGGLLHGNTVVDPNLAANQAAADKIAADKAAADKAAADKAAADKAAADTGGITSLTGAGNAISAPARGSREWYASSTPEQRAAYQKETSKVIPEGYIDTGIDGKLVKDDGLGTLIQLPNGQFTNRFGVAPDGTLRDYSYDKDKNPNGEGAAMFNGQLLTFKEYDNAVRDYNLTHTNKINASTPLDPNTPKDFYSKPIGYDDYVRLGIGTPLPNGDLQLGSGEIVTKAGISTDTAKSTIGTDTINLGNVSNVGNVGKSDVQIGAELINQNPDGTLQNTTLLPPGYIHTPQLAAAIAGQKQQVAPTYTQVDYIPPETRNGALFQNALKADPSLQALANWSASQDAAIAGQKQQRGLGVPSNEVINSGIVTPNINNVVSKENLNTDVKGTNGESGVVPLLYADMAKNTGRVPTPMVQGWGGTPIPETSMTTTGTPVLTESIPNSNLDNQSYTITSNPNIPVGITSLVGPQQVGPQQVAPQQVAPQQVAPQQVATPSIGSREWFKTATADQRADYAAQRQI